MESLFGGKGRVEIAFARGWISGWEALQLCPGGVVLGETEAGTAADLLFEGRSLARGEVYIVGDRPGVPLFALRVSGLDREAREVPEPPRGDGLTEVLPLEICVGEASYSLAELSQASCSSIVSLDSPLDAASPVLLRIAGREAGRGRAALLGERLGILLDEVAPGAGPEAEPAPTGAWLSPEEVKGKRVKLYDFRKPDRFTLRSIVALEEIHQRAAEALSQRTGGLEGLKVALVDQLTWGEWLDMDRAAGRRLFRSTMDRPGRSYERETWPSRTGAALLRPNPARHPLSTALDGKVERWTAEEEKLLGEAVLFVAAGGSLRDLDPAEILAALRAGWRQVADSCFSAPEGFGAPPLWDYAEGGARIEGDGRGLYRNEMVALVRFEAPGGDIDVVYAARALYPHTKALDRHARYLAPR